MVFQKLCNFVNYPQRQLLQSQVLMKQLTNAQPLVYRLPNSQLITSLAYIDQDIPELKSKVQYLIKAQEANMAFNPEDYLRDIQVPYTPFADSEHFKKQIARIMAKIESEPGQKKKSNKNQLKTFQISSIKGNQITDEVQQSVNKASIRHEMNLYKETNLEIYQKFGPILMKEQIAALDKRKKALQQRIEAEKKTIQEINKKRKYSHLQAQQRQETISSRTQVMIHKKRRID